MSESKPHSELRRAIEETRRRYGFPDIEKRYPATMLDTFFLKDAIALEEQYKHLENELDDMTGQFCNEAIHLTRAEDRVRELEEQYQAALDALREASLHQGLPEDAPPDRIAAHFRGNREFAGGFRKIAEESSPATKFLCDMTHPGEPCPAKKHEDYTGADWQGEGPEPPWASNQEEQLEVALHRCTFPECVEGEKPERCGRCGDALALQSVTNELVRMKEQFENIVALRDDLTLKAYERGQEVERLKEQLQSAQQEASDMRQAAAGMSADVTRLGEQVETLRQLNDRVIAERDSWERECNGLSEQLEAFQELAQDASDITQVGHGLELDVPVNLGSVKWVESAYHVLLTMASLASNPASEPVVGGDGRTPIIDAVTGQQIHTPPGAK